MPGISPNGFLWVIGVTRPVTVGVRKPAPRHQQYSFGFKLARRLELPSGNFRRGPVVFPTTVATKIFMT